MGTSYFVQVLITSKTIHSRSFLKLRDEDVLSDAWLYSYVQTYINSRMVTVYQPAIM